MNESSIYPKPHISLFSEARKNGNQRLCEQSGSGGEPERKDPKSVELPPPGKISDALGVQG